MASDEETLRTNLGGWRRSLCKQFVFSSVDGKIWPAELRHSGSVFVCAVRLEVGDEELKEEKPCRTMM